MADYEREVINAILADNAVVDSLGLVPEDFQAPLHRRVFKVASMLIDGGMHADIVAIAHADETLTGSALSGYAPMSAANAEFYAEHVRQSSTKRQLLIMAREMIDSVDSREPAELLEEAEANLLRIGQRRWDSVGMLRDCLLDTVEYVEQLHSNKGEFTGIPSGYADLDRRTRGFQAGEVIVIAARTSIGKTALALNMAENMAKAKRSVGFFSCEMSKRSLALRMLSSSSGVSHLKIRMGNITEGDIGAISAAANDLYEATIYLDDTPNIKWPELKSKARVMARRGVEIVFIDYLTLISYGDKKMPRYERVGELVREMKILARELNIPVVTMSQLNRMAEGAVPSLSELRQSGEIEEHADVIMLLHRERGERETTLMVAKHRNGPTANVPLTFIEERTRFESASREVTE